MSGTAANTYRVGDFVYFDDPTSPDAPYQIRRIDELNRTQNGVEARVVLYVRRRDVPQNLLKIADQAQRRFDNYFEIDKKKPENFNSKGFVVASNGDDVKKEGDDDEEMLENDREEQTENQKLQREEVTVEGTEKQEDEEKIKTENDIKKEEVETTANTTTATTTATTATTTTATTTATTAPPKVEQEKKMEKKTSPLTIDWGDGGLPIGAEQLTPSERLKLRQHEVFLSRQSEVLPAHQIRGKCRVTLLGEVEKCDGYLAADDSFFYSLVYDPVNQTLLADKGAIRVGERYQAEVEEWTKENGTELKKEVVKDMEEEEEEEEGNGALKIDEDDETTQPSVNESTKVEQVEVERDVQVYHPHHNLSERDIDQFLIVARAVGTFARAIDSSSSSKIPTLHMAAACASRDVTIFHAMSLLHHANYDVGQAVKYLVPPANKQHYPLESDKTTGHQTQVLGGPLLCRDQMEEWSTPEANLFDEALEKCGKDFNDIRADYLPWKSMRDIVEYYYQYKASNRYTDRKKAKQAEADTKLKQVYIPNYNKATSAIIGNFNMTQSVTKSEVLCENCSTDESQNWYSWGLKKAQLRLCQQCWFKWKKQGGLDRKHAMERFDKIKPTAVVQNNTNLVSSNGVGGGNQPKAMTQTAVVNPMTKLGGGATSTSAVAAAAAVAAGLQNKGFNNQSLLAAAKNAFHSGQLSKAQWIQLQQKLCGMVQQQQQQQHQQHQQQQQNQHHHPTAVAKPASKPNIVFYTTVCRRTIRRILPKSALNMRRLARKPFYQIDNEAVLKSVAITDRSTLVDTARSLAAAANYDRFNEAEFHKGLIHLQHTISAAAAAASSTAVKRPASVATQQNAGEPPIKLSKRHQQASSSSSSSLSRGGKRLIGNSNGGGGDMGNNNIVDVFGVGGGGNEVDDVVFDETSKSLEKIGNTLLAVNNAIARGVPYVNVSVGDGTSTLSHSAKMRAPFQIPIRLPDIQVPTQRDSKWIELNQHGVRFIAGPRLKVERRKMLQSWRRRKVCRRPVDIHDYLEPMLTYVSPLFAQSS